MISEDLDLEISSHRGGESNARWLISYADMVTLLLCFFLMFFSIEQAEDKKDTHLQILDFISNKLGVNLPSDIAAAAKPTPEVAPIAISQVEAPPLTTTIAENLRGLKLTSSAIDVVENPKSVIIRYRGEHMFASGAYALSEEATQFIDKTSSALSEYKDKVHIHLQGHTDPDPVRQGLSRRYLDNLELSALRAAAAYRIFYANGFSGENLSIVGYGPNQVEYGQSLRSVSIKVDVVQ